ncbi:hypothetical protein RZS08_57220, partial [Arthrospira platensis SPKY1]|nr:hypothetical protein [Arthrospira platensis SPKY1]
MNLIELKATTQALRRQLDEYERIKPCCVTCLKYEAGVCSQYQAAPPDDWIKGPVDCEHWDY